MNLKTALVGFAPHYLFNFPTFSSNKLYFPSPIAAVAEKTLLESCQVSFKTETGRSLNGTYRFSPSTKIAEVKEFIVKRFFDSNIQRIEQAEKKHAITNFSQHYLGFLLLYQNCAMERETTFDTLNFDEATIEMTIVPYLYPRDHDFCEDEYLYSEEDIWGEDESCGSDSDRSEKTTQEEFNAFMKNQGYLLKSSGEFKFSSSEEEFSSSSFEAEGSLLNGNLMDNSEQKWRSMDEVDTIRTTSW